MTVSISIKPNQPMMDANVSVLKSSEQAMYQTERSSRKQQASASKTSYDAVILGDNVKGEHNEQFIADAIDVLDATEGGMEDNEDEDDAPHRGHTKTAGRGMVSDLLPISRQTKTTGRGMMISRRCHHSEGDLSQLRGKKFEKAKRRNSTSSVPTYFRMPKTKAEAKQRRTSEKLLDNFDGIFQIIHTSFNEESEYADRSDDSSDDSSVESHYFSEDEH